MTQPIPRPGQYPPPAAPEQAAPGARHTPQHAAPAPEARPTIGALVASVTGQLSGILRDEIELNKSKARSFATPSGKGAGLLVTAAVFALFLLGWTLHTIEVLLALVLPAWAASLIVVVLLLVIVLALALAGKNALQSAQKHRPDPAASVAATKEAIQKGLGK